MAETPETLTLSRGKKLNPLIFKKENGYISTNLLGDSEISKLTAL